LEPLAGATTVGPNCFEAAASQSVLFLQSNNSRYPAGLVRITVRIDEGNVPIDIAVRIESESQPVAEIRMTEERPGKFGIFVSLPPDVLAVRFAVRNVSGRVEIKKHAMQRVSRFGFVLALLFDRQAAKRALRYALEHGFRAAVTNILAEPGRRTVSPYREWIRHHATLLADDIAAIRAHIEGFSNKPAVSVLMVVQDVHAPFLSRSIASVTAQLYPCWNLYIVQLAPLSWKTRSILAKAARGDARIKLLSHADADHLGAAYDRAFAVTSDPFIAILGGGDELAAHALYMVANEINTHPDANVICSDEDKIDRDGNRYGPCFKPDWNYDLLLTQARESHLSVFRASLLQTLGAFKELYADAVLYDLMLRVAEHTAVDLIRHIPQVLYHRRAFAAVDAASGHLGELPVGAVEGALRNHFRRRGIPAEVAITNGWKPQIRYPLLDPLPLVSLLVPTKDRLVLLEKCVSGLLDRTRYSNIEIVILDNDSCEPETLSYLAAVISNPRVRVVRCPGEFNFAAINNLGVSLARGTVIGLINSDIEVIDRDWLHELVRHALRPNVGVVGAKLLYPDGTVQHAGVVLGITGVAGHIFRHILNEESGYFHRAQLTQELSAVTGACIVMRKECYLQVAGMDDTNLKVAFNDLDLCLKIRQAGYDVVWTPHALLYHAESASRGSDDTPGNIERFLTEIGVIQGRWSAALACDPFYSPNLTVAADDFSLAEPPRASRPWL
jgi:GT2 family glycosyltransferase